MTLTLRNVKGSALTHAEMDGNFTHFRDLIALPTVTITDAAVAMTANRRYVGSIASFTADRNYTLPAGTAGDVIEVLLTAGDDTYELILLGASGVSINGGTAATEWSRLFISNEFVRFRCHAENDWRVEIDGRAFEYSLAKSNSTGSISISAWNKAPLEAVSDPFSLLGINEIVPRRPGIYAVDGFIPFYASAGKTCEAAIHADTIGTTVHATTDRLRRWVESGVEAKMSNVSKTHVLTGVTRAFSMWVWVNTSSFYFNSIDQGHELTVRRIG